MPPGPTMVGRPPQCRPAPLCAARPHIGRPAYSVPPGTRFATSRRATIRSRRGHGHITDPTRGLVTSSIREKKIMWPRKKHTLHPTNQRPTGEITVKPTSGSNHKRQRSGGGGSYVPPGTVGAARPMQGRPAPPVGRPTQLLGRPAK